MTSLFATWNKNRPPSLRNMLTVDDLNIAVPGVLQELLVVATELVMKR